MNYFCRYYSKSIEVGSSGQCINCNILPLNKGCIYRVKLKEK